MKARALVLLSVLLLGVASVAGAGKKDLDREEPGKRLVQGVVTDSANQPVETAVVQLKNMKTLQVISYITQKDGLFRFRGLSTNIDYVLKADHNGVSSSNKTLSSFDNRTKAIINLKIAK